MDSLPPKTDTDLRALADAIRNGLDAVLAAVDKKKIDAKEAATSLTEQRRMLEHLLLPRLPDVAPELYANRADRSENAIEFLNRVWGPYLEAGVLYQFQLSKLDPQLMKAIRNYCKDNPDAKEPQDYIPRKRDLGDKITGSMTPDKRKSVDSLRNAAAYRARRKEVKS